MKTLILFTLFVSSFSLWAKCPIYSEDPVSSKLEKALIRHDFEITNDKSAPYTLKQDSVEIVTGVIEVSGDRARLIRKRWGFSTIYNIHKDKKFFHQSYGDAINIFADEFYTPTDHLKARSKRKAIRHLKSDLPSCEQ